MTVIATVVVENSNFDSHSNYFSTIPNDLQETNLEIPES
jgi:hypothetical protein